MKNYLVLIMSCRKNRSIQDKIKNTILKNVPKNIKVLFVEGDYETTEIIENVLQLNVKDDYENFIYKVQAAYKHAMTLPDWDYLVKADDDVYLMMNNLSTYEPPEGYDYYGMLNSATLNGMFYILPKETVQFLSTVPISGGNIIGEAWGGLKLHCPQEKWKDVIPEDSYFSLKMIENKMKGYNLIDKVEFVKYIGVNMKDPNWIGIHPEILFKRNSLLAFFDVEEYEFPLYYNLFTPTKNINSDFVVMVCTCRKNRAKIDQIRKTWALNIPSNVRVVYLMGGYNETRLNGDILESKVSDNYKNFIYKVQDGYKFLSERAEFKYLIKCDDDVYVNLNNIPTFNYKEYDIIGRIWDGIHMCGPLYILKKPVVDYLAEHKVDDTWVNKNAWAGLAVHCPNQAEWKDVIPEDYYFSEVLNKTTFKRDHDPKAITLIKYGAEEHITSAEDLSKSIGFFDVDTIEFRKYKKELEQVNLQKKVAFGIIAHKDLISVNNIIYQITQNSKHHVFVYVDPKCNEDIRAIKQHSNVHIIKKTKPLYWADWSFVHAQLRILKAIKDSMYQFDYVSFHGGKDLLMSNINELQEFLFNGNDKNYIDCFPLPRNDLLFGGNWRYQYNWPQDLIRRDEHKFEELGRNKIQDKCMEPADNEFTCPLYSGLRWFTITKEVADYCLEYSINHRAFMKSFKKTYLPAEAYFQTLLMNTRYKSTITRIVPTLMKKSTRTEVFNIKNFTPPKERVYFGRKFDINADSNLVTKVMYKTTESNYMPVHFVWMDKTGEGFKFWHYVALKSFIKNNSNKRIIVHTNAALTEPWWAELKDDVEFRFIPKEYIKPNLKYFSHNVDFYRYLVLFNEGGCYIDFDTITTGNIDYIVDADKLVFSSCHKGKYEFSGGFFICPKAGHPLLKDVLNVYHNDYRGSNWNFNATYVPGELAKNKYQQFTKYIADRDILFPINWENDKDVMGYEQRHELIYRIRTAKRSISVHFYNAAYNKMLEETTFENYKTNQTIYALMCRIVLDNNWNLD